MRDGPWTPPYGGTMKHYCIKTRAGDGIEYLDIVREIEDSYVICVTRFRNGSTKVSEETITRHLFNLCLKTGYIYEMTNAAASVA